MIVDKRYKDYQEGKVSKSVFIQEAKADPVIKKLITSTNTFEEVISILKSKGFIYENAEKPKAFSITGWIKESLSDEINQPKDFIHSEHVNAFEYEKGWRYELKAIGKADAESLTKAQQKAVKNLEQDPIYYTKLEMGSYAPEGEDIWKMVDVSDGKVKNNPKTEMKPVKSKEEKEQDVKELQDRAKAAGDSKKKSTLNEAELATKPASHAFRSEDDKFFVVDMSSGKIVMGFEKPEDAVDYSDGLNKGNKPSADRGFMPFSRKELSKKGINFRATKDWEDGQPSKEFKPTFLSKVRDIFKIKEAAMGGTVSKLTDLTKSHKNDKNPIFNECDCDKDPENKVPGGDGDNISAADVDQKEFSLGLSIEAEHTNDPEIAKELTLDHLAKDRHYYTKLIKARIEEAAKLPVETRFPFYVTNGHKLIAGFKKDSEAREWATSAENKYKKLVVVTADKITKAPYALSPGKPKDWLDIGTNRFMWYGGEDRKLYELKEKIRKVVRKKLNEAIDFSQFDVQVDEPNYKGTIKRDAKGWSLYDEHGKPEDTESTFSTLSNLLKHYEIDPKDLKGAYADKHRSNLKETSYVPLPKGPDVDRDNLERLLRAVDWPKTPVKEDGDPKYTYTGMDYRKRINQEYKDSIKTLVDRLGQEGIDLYNSYAPEGCKYGQKYSILEEDTEVAQSKTQQDLKDMEDMKPEDLAKEVLDGKYDPNSIKNKAALKLLAHAVKKGNKDTQVKKAFMHLADKYKNKK